MYKKKRRSDVTPATGAPSSKLISTGVFPPRRSCAASSMAGRQARAAVPRAIAAMQPHVEAFEAQVLEEREEGAVSDDELRQAAQRALANLGEEPAVAPHTFDRTRAREDMRRFNPDAAARGRGLPDRAGLGRALRAADLLCQRMDLAKRSAEALGLPRCGLLPRLRAGHRQLARLSRRDTGGLGGLACRLVFFAAPAATLMSGWSRFAGHGPLRGFHER